MTDKKSALKSLAEGMQADKARQEDNPPKSLGDVLAAITAEPNAKKRKKIIKDYAARHADAADFLVNNEQLITAEAEAALVSAAVGRTETERVVTYRGGRRYETTRVKRIPPNVKALDIYLKNRVPERYSDHPAEPLEIEDVSEINEVIDNADNRTKDDTV